LYVLFIWITMNNYGLNDQFAYYEYEFDSSDAYQPFSSGELSTDWPKFNFIRTLKNIAAIKNLEAQIPFTWYVFNEKNNQFWLQEGINPPVLVTIPPGNYNSTSMAAQLKTSLDASLGVHTYTVTFLGASATGPALNKFQISSSTALVGDFFELTFGPDAAEGAEIKYYLGMNQDNDSSLGTGVANTAILISPNVVNITGPNYIYINSNEIGALTSLFIPDGLGPKGGWGPQMAKIPVDVQPGGIIYWKDPDPQKWFDLENLPNLMQVDFFLTLGNTLSQVPLKLNGQAFSLKMGVLENRLDRSELLANTYANKRRKLTHFPQ